MAAAKCASMPHWKDVQCVTVSPDNISAATGSLDCTIKVPPPATFSDLFTTLFCSHMFRQIILGCKYLSYSLDSALDQQPELENSCIVVISLQAIRHLASFSLAFSNRLALLFSSPALHNTDTLLFSSHSSLLSDRASSSKSCFAQLWSYMSMKPRLTLGDNTKSATHERHTMRVTGVVFGHDSEHIASCSDDGQVILWVSHNPSAPCSGRVSTTLGHSVMHRERTTVLLDSFAFSVQSLHFTRDQIALATELYHESLGISCIVLIAWLGIQATVTGERLCTLRPWEESGAPTEVLTLMLPSS